MRLFTTFESAVREIYRDLYKAPKVKSSRVQHLLGDFLTGEASPYAYAIQSAGMPNSSGDLYDIAYQTLDWWANEYREAMEYWLDLELAQRVQDVPSYMDSPSEDEHVELGQMKEGNHYGYTYAERTIGMVTIMANQLIANPDTRRCFWPIFQPIDAIRAEYPTRVPCTLGYQAQIRPGSGDQDIFEFTIISRSCDYEKFWASDIWFAYRIGEAVLREVQGANLLTNPKRELKYGNVYHHILSFHRFIEDSEETY